MRIISAAKKQVKTRLAVPMLLLKSSFRRSCGVSMVRAIDELTITASIVISKKRWRMVRIQRRRSRLSSVMQQR